MVPQESAEPADGALAGVVRRCDFPSPGDGPVSLAVSGGPDSLALLVLAATAGLSATVFHVDHGLRQRSSEDAGVVAAAAKCYGMSFELVQVEVASGADLEARARRARYAALPHGVMTGHTMDDQVETILLNLMRGAGLDGLAGMRKQRSGRPRRPLLALRRYETAEVCRRAGLVPVVDETNRDMRFRRNRVRAELLPLLDDVAGRDVIEVIARQADLLSEDAALLDELASSLDPTDARALSRAPAPVARRAIRSWLRATEHGGDEEEHPPSRAEVERVLAVASGTAVACEVAGGRRVRRSGGRLSVSPPM